MGLIYDKMLGLLKIGQLLGSSDLIKTPLTSSLFKRIMAVCYKKSSVLKVNFDILYINYICRDLPVKIFFRSMKQKLFMFKTDENLRAYIGLYIR